MIKYPISIILVLPIVLMSCSEKGIAPLALQTQDLAEPFNYNFRNIYIYDVKMTAMDGEISTDTLGMECSNHVELDNPDQKSMAWLYLTQPQSGHYTYNTNKANNCESGIASTPTSLFIHPPRYGQYQILETSPFPYILFPLAPSKTWDWELAVGQQWSTGAIRWKGNDTFHTHYMVIDTVAIDVPAGKISCYHIHATNASDLGSSSADFYYSYQFGLVKLSYLPLDKTKIQLSFIGCTADPALFDQGRDIPNYMKLEE